MNVILILIDTLRPDFLGSYGNPWVQTPNFDQFAAQSVVFENAYVGSSPCMPARRDLWTGRYEFPWRGWGPLEQGDLRLPDLIRPAVDVSMLITDHYHYWHAGSGNYHNGFHGYEFIRGQEDDAWKTQSDAMRPVQAPLEKLWHGEPYLRNMEDVRYEEDYFAPQVFRKSMNWLERNRTRQPFFLMVESFDPHEPWDPPFPYNELYNPGYKGDRITFPKYGTSDQFTPEEIEEMRALYTGEITLVDRWFGLFIDKVKMLGLMENTCIIVTSDHGHMLGEHQTVGKPNEELGDLWLEMAHIPMMIYHPSLPGGARLGQLVQNVDLLPTILDIFSLPAPNCLHGKSLMPLMKGQVKKIREMAVWAVWGHAVNITDGSWTLMHWPSNEANRSQHWFSPLHPEYLFRHWPRERYEDHWILHPPHDFCQPSQLYNMESDPRQQHNVIADQPEVATRLRRAIKTFLQDVGAPSQSVRRLALDE